jgi:hypothetical protein
VIYDKNASTGRKPNWWVRYWVEGVEVREPGRGSKRETAAYEVELKRQIKAGTWTHPRTRKGNSARFEQYARTVLTRRIARGVATAAKDERGHVENHLIPVFGDMEMRDMTFKRIKDGFGHHINEKGLAGRTVRNIHATLRAILVEAAEDELIAFQPPPLSTKRDHLPPPVDKVEGWREDARFEPGEVRALATCEAIPPARLIMYLTYLLTGSRFSEILELRVRHYNRERQPLHGLSVHAAKVGRHRGLGRRRREVPVHPELAAWLDWWLASEWAIMHGRRPGADDLLFPTISVRRRNRGLATCSHNELYKQWQRHDLPAAGLRHRKLHDARRTLLSALKNAGVENDLRRKITHYSAVDRVLDGYTTWEWRVLCEAIQTVRWDVPAPAPQRIRFLPISAAGAVKAGAKP